MPEIAIPYKPRPQQREIHKNLKRFNVLVCHRRMGKTVTAINQLIRACTSCKLQRPRYAYIAPLYKQAKTVAWDYLMHYSLPIPGISINQSELRIDYPNQGRVQLLGADNPDSLRGIYLDGVVIDEVAQCPPSLYGEILRPALSDRKGWVIFIGTPKGHDHFYDLYRHAQFDPAWYSKLYRASETGIIDPDELAQARAEMSENEYLQEFECDFDISSSFILIPIAIIDAAFSREIDVAPTAPRVIGMDVGMSLGGDASAYVVRQGGQIVAADEIRLDNTLTIAGWFRDAFEKHGCQRGFIDSVGYGSGVAHTMQGWDMPVTSVNTGDRADSPDQFANSKAELWWRTKDFFTEGDCAMPDEHLFRKMATELSTPEYDYTTSGKIKIQSKKDLVKAGVSSPNLADALVLTFANSGFFGGVL
jgi:hypothetical protein